MADPSPLVAAALHSFKVAPTPEQIAAKRAEIAASGGEAAASEFERLAYQYQGKPSPKVDFDADAYTPEVVDLDAMQAALQSFKVTPQNHEVVQKFEELRAKYGEATAMAFREEVGRHQRKPVDTSKRPAPDVERSLQSFEAPPTDDQIAAERDRLQASTGRGGEFQDHALGLRREAQYRPTVGGAGGNAGDLEPGDPGERLVVSKQEKYTSLGPTEKKLLDKIGALFGR